MIAAKCI